MLGHSLSTVFLPPGTDNSTRRPWGRRPSVPSLSSDLIQHQPQMGAGTVGSGGPDLQGLCSMGWLGGSREGSASLNPDPSPPPSQTLISPAPAVKQVVNQNPTHLTLYPSPSPWPHSPFLHTPFLTTLNRSGCPPSLSLHPPPASAHCSEDLPVGRSLRVPAGAVPWV